VASGKALTSLSSKDVIRAGTTGLSRDEILEILETRAQSAQNELASQVDAGADVLDYLASNGAVATRRAVAANPAAPPSANHTLANDADEDVRAELARKIGRLMPDLSADETDRLRTLTLETLDRLAHDQETRVRAILSDEIKALACIPKKIVLALAHDIEEIVAGPILQYSPLLSDTDLMEIIASAKADQTLKAIAGRQPLSANLADAIVGSLDIPAVAALLLNPKAEIREKTLDRIIAEAEQVRALQQPLVLRADLSPRAIRRVASFVGAELIEQLSERHGLDATTQKALKTELRTRLERASAPAAISEEKASAAVAAALRARTLGEAFVVAAAEAGHKETVALALSELARVPTEIVRKILAAKTARPITALVWRAKLHMRVSFKIQSQVMHLPAQELLPARGGVGFPMTEDEMRWHLAYFDVE
jgi:uncharacterized protein (DUF2336 family)